MVYIQYSPEGKKYVQNKKKSLINKPMKIYENSIVDAMK